MGKINVPEDWIFAAIVLSGALWKLYMEPSNPLCGAFGCLH